jgi:hypothetical protein
MFTKLRITNFKSWADTGNMSLAPITGLFGANSSGKTSILQFLLALKQTVESTDRTQVFNLGDKRTIVDLGTFFDIIYAHETNRPLAYEMDWKLSTPFRVPSRLQAMGYREEIEALHFEAAIKQQTTQDLPGKLYLENFVYNNPERSSPIRLNYITAEEGYEFSLPRHQLAERPDHKTQNIPTPVRFYGFPDEVFAYYQGFGWLSEFALAVEKLFSRLYYLGPLREYPERSYTWSGEVPGDVGRRGDATIAALLASRASGTRIEERVAAWLKEMGLIHDFNLHPISPNRKEYELKIKITPDSPEALITDIGFGVSQILPILVLCYYVPEGSILLFEQPEIHLHPKVQYILADVFIDVARSRNVQIIFESHSEHILQRFQRRAAEEPQLSEWLAFYFTQIENGESRLTDLALDEFGNIKNWPEDFFGDEMGEMSARMRAEMKRKINPAR